MQVLFVLTLILSLTLLLETVEGKTNSFID